MFEIHQVCYEWFCRIHSKKKLTIIIGPLVQRKAIEIVKMSLLVFIYILQEGTSAMCAHKILAFIY